MDRRSALGVIALVAVGAVALVAITGGVDGGPRLSEVSKETTPHTLLTLSSGSATYAEHR